MRRKYVYHGGMLNAQAAQQPLRETLKWTIRLFGTKAHI